MTSSTEAVTEQLRQTLQQYWGYASFRPLQVEAMSCVMEGIDSVVVLPTGGGKSLCYQVPALCQDGLAIVVSPLISLMKDQVDTLRGCGVPAACINSTLTLSQKRQVANEIRSGALRLLYIAPEKLLTERTLKFLQNSNPSFIAIDEAHCISEWGHDFRPEYHELSLLRDAFPGISIHGYTATATESVREDICNQLQLRAPNLLVGEFDRPNLTYRVVQRKKGFDQIREIVDRFPGESGIVYCISRKNVEETAERLRDAGYRALPYHAGLSDRDRRNHQEAFIRDDVEIIVATVAFGMGIDKPNVRFVIHAGMPKSLEGYQQESGRAGRDGLEAECCLLYSGGDYGVWKSMLEEKEGTAREGAFQTLSAMYGYCTNVTCRHQHLTQYFGQQIESRSCGACDVCLGEIDLVDEALEISQKILSCVVRLSQRFGGDYTALVLSGSKNQRILEQQHHELSTWGVLSEWSKPVIRDWIEQLVGQGFLAKSGEYNQLLLTESGQSLLRGEETPLLAQPRRPEAGKPRRRRATATEKHSWEGVDRGLYDALRELRRTKADERQVPAYVVFGDASLRDMARRRPTSLANFLDVHGVGKKKCQDYGDEFVACISQHCSEHQLPTDLGAAD